MSDIENVKPECSKEETSEGETCKKKSVKKFETSDKCVRKNKSKVLKSGVTSKYDETAGCASNNFKKSTVRLSTEDSRSKKFESQTENSETDHGNVFKQEKRNVSETRKRTSKGRERLKTSTECKNKSNGTAKGKARPWIKKETFPEYISEKKINKCLKNQNSASVQYVEGYLRVNPFCSNYSYLTLSGEECDLLIFGLWNRNRACNGDLVVARINEPEEWHKPSGQVQKTGVVVYIREKIHSRKTVGQFKHFGTDIMFCPRDHQMPLIKISTKSLEEFSVLNSYEDKLYLAAITSWEKPQYAHGEIEKVIGSIGNIKTELSAILLEYDLDVTPYSEDIIKKLPAKNYSLTESDIKDREDWRYECVFTIDPETAVDLDDALSCKPLENGNYEVGVHISDVTHFLEFLSPLDIQVSKRATTVYMADNVYHMLPKQLYHLCSLAPGQDKLTFSVVLEMTQNAEIVKHRFVKTIIKSCCQMSYQHAQKFIEHPKNNWPDDFLTINGDFSIDDLSRKINILHDLAVQIRAKRFQNGSLEINQPKLYVSVDRATGLPISYGIKEQQQDSNRMIQEFMLIANITVATHLYDTIPTTALLCNHPEPLKFTLSTTRHILQSFGIHLNITSSGLLHASIKRYEQELESESNEKKITMKHSMMVINNLCSKAMTGTTYKCSSTAMTKEDLKYYALNVPLYTHFTSPIRRYADCVVHRLLYSTMTNTALPKKWSEKMCKQIAANCNAKKNVAAAAEKRSYELYLTYFIDLNGPIVTIAIVSNVQESSIDVILCQVGINLRIFLKNIKGSTAISYSSKLSIPTITIFWENRVAQVISTFTLVDLSLQKHPESFDLVGILLPPKEKLK